MPTFRIIELNILRGYPSINFMTKVDASDEKEAIKIACELPQGICERRRGFPKTRPHIIVAEEKYVKEYPRDTLQKIMIKIGKEKMIQ